MENPNIDIEIQRLKEKVAALTVEYKKQHKRHVELVEHLKAREIAMKMGGVK